MERTRILGIDPGLRHCGWGIIDQDGNHYRFVDAGVINPIIDDGTVTEQGSKSGALGRRLFDLYEKLNHVIATYSPDIAAVEETFLNKNPNTTLKLGHARGVALLTPSLCGLAVHEYSAKQVKQAVVGTGGADKNQVKAMVEILLPAAKATLAKNSLDASDALAVAICHGNYYGSIKKWQD